MSEGGAERRGFRMVQLAIVGLCGVAIGAVAGAKWLPGNDRGTQPTEVRTLQIAGKVGGSPQPGDPAEDVATDRESIVAAARQAHRALCEAELKELPDNLDVPFVGSTTNSYPLATDNASRDERFREIWFKYAFRIERPQFPAQPLILRPSQFLERYGEQISTMSDLALMLPGLKLTGRDRVVIDGQGVAFVVRPGGDRKWRVAGVLPGGFLSSDRPYELIKDVIYGNKCGVSLTMDILKPKEKSLRAMVVWIVSDTWMSGSRSLGYPQIDDFIRHGYTLALVTHGSAPRFSVADCVADVHRAIRYVRFHAGSIGIDPERIAVTGTSAGGHLALMLGVAEGKGPAFPPPGDALPDGKADPVESVSSKVQAVIAIYPPTDFTNFGGEEMSILDHSATKRVTGIFDLCRYDATRIALEKVCAKEELQAAFSSLSPARLVTRKAAPTLLLHGEIDPNVPLQQSQLMAEKLRAAGVPVELVVIPQAGHGWTYDPSPDAANVERDKTIAWLSRYLVGADN